MFIEDLLAVNFLLILFKFLLIICRLEMKKVLLTIKNLVDFNRKFQQNLKKPENNQLNQQNLSILHYLTSF